MHDLNISQQLAAIADEKNAAFVRKLTPDLPPESVLGCRTPQLRRLAASLELSSDAVQDFLHALPHQLFDENQLHAFLIARYRDFDICIQAVCDFLPYVNNWATCDQLSPAVFRRQPQKLLPYIRTWLDASETYTIRFGIGMLMQHFLDAHFAPQYLQWVAAVPSEAYYVQMEQAWYFATALAKQPDAAMPYLTERRLPEWVHRKTIQKAIESRRIPDETKAYLRTLRQR